MEPRQQRSKRLRQKQYFLWRRRQLPCKGACFESGNCQDDVCGRRCCQWHRRSIEDVNLARFIAQVPTADHEPLNSVKLVVNTYVGSRPLLVLLHSLLAIGFDRFEDTVFVRGGGGRDRPPRWSTLDAISGAFIDKRRAVLIDVAESNLDWHGLAALNTYRAHPLVRGDGYFYALDSTTFTYAFPGIFNSLNFSHPRVVFTVPLPNSNVAAFGEGVVRAYGRSYEAKVSKIQGLFMEFNTGSVSGMRSLPSWGVVKFCGKRSIYDRRSMYKYFANGTVAAKDAVQRITVSYPGLGVLKHVQWGRPLPHCTALWGCVAQHAEAGKLRNSGLVMAPPEVECPNERARLKRARARNMTDALTVLLHGQE